MSRTNLCCLCVQNYRSHKCIYDENGHENEAHQLIMKYFEPALLNMDKGNFAATAVVCLECWQQISNFYKYQQSVYQAQKNFNDTVQMSEPECEDEFLTDNESLPDDQQDCNKTVNYLLEEGPFVDNTTYMPRKSQDSVKINVKTEDCSLVDDVQGTFLSEPKTERITDPIQQQTAITLPKLEIMDVLSGNDDSSDDMSDETDNAVVSSEYNENVDDITDELPTKDAITKKKFIKESDCFIQQWNSELPCAVCSDKFSTYSLLRHHFTTKHPLERCYILCCKRKLFQRYLIEEHIRVHMDPNTFKCEFCGKCHSGKSQLMVHIVQRHPESGHGPKSTSKRKGRTDEEVDDLLSQWPTILECALCKETCSTLKLLQIHFRHYHPQNQVYVECCNRRMKTRSDIVDHVRNHVNPMTSTCELCNSEFNSHKCLVLHMRRKHCGPTASRKIRTSDKQLEQLISMWKSNLECVVCTLKFPTLKLIQAHFREKHKPKEFYIECCNRKLKWRHAIENHARYHLYPVTFTCEKCSESFESERKLIDHLIHSNTNNDDTASYGTEKMNNCVDL